MHFMYGVILFSVCVSQTRSSTVVVFPEYGVSDPQEFQPEYPQEFQPEYPQEFQPEYPQDIQPVETGEPQPQSVVSSGGGSQTIGLPGSPNQASSLQNIHPEIHDINFPPHSSVSSQQFLEFRYEGPLGPDHWPELFASCAGGRQSPIAIQRVNSANVNYEFFTSKNYDRYPLNATITNNGHTASVTLPDGATIGGANLPGDYEFLNFHFHWGSDSSRGSEHILEGIHYPLELHLVHWNLKYASSLEAMNHKDGIAVLSVLFHVEPLDNFHLTPIIKALGSVIKSGTSVTFTPNFKLWDLLPSDTADYYRYSGSLTTPECSEAVIWTIFANTLPISEQQMKAFRRLLDIENRDRENNHRPVQPLNSRIVYRNGV